MEELEAIFAPSVHENRQQETSDVLREIMAEVDKDGDNHISFSEFNGAVTAMLKHAL